MLTKSTIVRAWKDKRFRASLSEELMQNLPPHPSGLIEIPEDALDTVAGGTGTYSCNGTPASACLDWSCGGSGGGSNIFSCNVM
ncbi:mersacidin/lichenicidin family type 2 lantibiotic [Candidatus Leptofilum sp.]|uniref:mersacidin/lichenicidin family type 2 lantibiotic n=1 Tax=Candidatus Leptofilum sp. TaxID=3241576 RepID=UPI003B5A37DD